MIDADSHDPQRFADLGRPRRIWAIGAVHGEVARLAGLHGAIDAAIRPGDRLVYLGNLLGRGPDVREAVDAALAFRRALIGRPGMLASDVVYLRGMQEEMWQKLLQLQLAPNPAEVLQWMIGQGLGPTLAAYGGRIEDGLYACRAGATAIARWTQGLRTAQRAAPGHEPLMSALRRAAYTVPPAAVAGSPPAAEPTAAAGPPPPRGVLLVNAGLDPTRPLFNQGDRFWWGGGAFNRIDVPFETFGRLIRGYDPAQAGLHVGPVTVSLDGGCGFGGSLVCGVFDGAGELVELLEA